MAVPPRTPKWIVVGQHNDYFHLWKEVHKDITHQLNELQLVERRVVEVECWIGGLSLQMEGVRATHTLSSQCHRAVHNSYCLLKTDVLR